VSKAKPWFGRRRFLFRAGILPLFLTRDSNLEAAPAPDKTVKRDGGTCPSRSEFVRDAAAGNLQAVRDQLERDETLLYARDSHGQSAYLLAAYAGKSNVTSFLDSKGIVLDAHEAAASGNVARIKALFRDYPGLILMPNAAGDTPLHAAARAGQAAVIDNVIGYGPDFSIANPLRQNETVAHIAVQCPSVDAAEDMAFATIGNGADPNAKIALGDTVLHCAARAGDLRVVKLILQKGGDASAKNASGRTPGEVARTSEHAEAAQLLESAATVPRDYYARRFQYASGFQPCSRDDTRGIPRDFVNAFVLYSHFDSNKIKQWLASCPDLLNTRASWDELAIEAAAHMGRTDIGEFLLARGGAYSLPTAIVFGSLADVRRMLTEDPRRIHERGAHSFPLLWYTAFGPAQIETAEYLMSQGAPIKEDLRGRTVLHIAAAAGHVELCRFFLEKGLNPRDVGANAYGKQDAIETARQANHPALANMLAEWPSRPR
jgi:ankyrin repeat protein